MPVIPLMTLPGLRIRLPRRLVPVALSALLEGLGQAYNRQKRSSTRVQAKGPVRPTIRVKCERTEATGFGSRMRHGLHSTVVIATAPERSPVGVSEREGYQQVRPRKLTIDERDAVCFGSNSWSLPP
jgi:hypothetical protein